MTEGQKVIRFRCNYCGQEMEEPILMRGLARVCPRCRNRVVVPQPSEGSPAQAGRRKPYRYRPMPGEESPDGQYELDRERMAQQGEDAVLAAQPKYESTAPPGGKCPKCGTPTRLGDTICVQCGLDFWTWKTARVIPVRRDDKYEPKPLDIATEEFVLALLKTPAYPLRDIGSIVAITLTVILVSGVAAIGGIVIGPAFQLAVLALLAAYFGAYMVNIVQSTLLGYDEPPALPQLTVDTLLVPLSWLLAIGVALWGPPAGLLFFAHKRPWLAAAAAALAGFAFAAGPMALLLVAGAGDLRLPLVKALFNSLARNAAHYLLLLLLAFVGCVLIVAAVAGLYALFINRSIFGLLGFFIFNVFSALVPLYIIAFLARALGIFGRYRERALDFGEGAEEGMNPLAGGLLIVLVVAALALGAYAAGRAADAAAELLHPVHQFLPDARDHAQPRPAAPRPP